MKIIRIICLSTALLIAPTLAMNALAQKPPASDRRFDMPAVEQANPDLTAAEIVRRGHAAAGGEIFVRPGSLFLSGYNIIYPAGGEELLWDHYAMWREFGTEKRDAHMASGKVRIEAWTQDTLALLLAFDGEQTWDKNGLMEDQSANAMWSANFGFGAIRHALDEGWTQLRETDDFIDGQLAYVIKLKDPSGGETLFAFRQSDFATLYVGFTTPRGWHERRYSHFFSLPGSDWMQAGRVRLFYNGVKANEAIWTHYVIGAGYPQELFQPAKPPTSPSWITAEKPTQRASQL